MCNTCHIFIVPCHRDRIVPKTCQPPGEIAKVLHTQASAVKQMGDRREGMQRYPQTSELIVANIWLNPLITWEVSKMCMLWHEMHHQMQSWCPRSLHCRIQHWCQVISGPKTLVIMSGIIQATVCKCMLVRVCFAQEYSKLHASLCKWHYKMLAVMIRLCLLFL